MNINDPIPWVQEYYSGCDGELILDAENNCRALVEYLCGLSFEELQHTHAILTEEENHANV